MRRRILVRRLGVLLIALGVTALAWGFATWRWGDPVTRVYTHWQQQKLADDYARVVSRYALAPERSTAAPRIENARAASDTRAREISRAREIYRAARRLRKEAGVGKPIGRLHVAKLGLHMMLVNGTDGESLRRGPGRDPRTFLPGEGKLVYIAGHRTTFAAPFSRIDRLRRGDSVILEMPYGRFAYTVSSWVIVPADDLDRLRSRGREEIALQACHPRFSAEQRYIVYAQPRRDVARRNVG